MPIFTERVKHARYAWKFMLPSIIGRDHVKKEDGISKCPLCGRHRDRGRRHLLLRCLGNDARQRELFTQLREEMLEACGAGSDLWSCVQRLAGVGKREDAANKVSSNLRDMYRQRTLFYRVVRKAAEKTQNCRWSVLWTPIHLEEPWKGCWVGR
jgi:hypothetical protein